MESYTKLTLFAMVLVSTLVTEPMVANGFSFCGVTTDGLKTCKPAVAKGVTPLPLPTPECCAALVDADMPCLCKFKDSSLLGTYGIDPKLAMLLPEKCNLPQANLHC
ncbi:hypothetical protein L6452_23170 [Arctium lappa]|uniref:Uncharacterized protein n=1 Tax=Arctium lappa TaxID=4217 RepID=A0ACB9B1K4_ARCLA|nr:hypothetical protein L6452_23170 [Arctium lappa]